QYPLILHRALASLRHVPEHTTWVHHVRDAKAPRLHCRWSWRLHTELARQIYRLDVLPPCVKVIDHELHHEVLRPFLLVVTLQDEPTGASSKDGDVAVEYLFEAKCFVETPRQIEILSRNEWTDQFRPSRDF